SIPVPPEDEQQSILRKVKEAISFIDRLEKALRESQERSSSLRKALLEQAHSGRLVRQHQNDEPASELLARIRAERASAKLTKRGSRPRTPMQAPVHSPSVTKTYDQEELPL